MRPQEMSLIDRVKSYASSAAVTQQPWLEILMADVLAALSPPEPTEGQTEAIARAIHAACNDSDLLICFNDVVCETAPCACAHQLARAALRAMPLQDHEWQDISRAPKDGTRVLVAAPSHLTMIGAWLEKRVTYMEGKWWSNNAPIIPDPTHWMPLPSPPGAVIAEERGT